MPATRYFSEQVLRKRPYLTLDMCNQVVRIPLRTETQPDGRIRHWGRVALQGEQKARILRVVTLDDEVPLHNALHRSGFPRGTAMKLHYYAETDSLYIELCSSAATETREILAGVNVDIGADGAIVGIDIDGASGKLDLATLETEGLTLGRLRAA